jgi:hypothetical protein
MFCTAYWINYNSLYPTVKIHPMPEKRYFHQDTPNRLRHSLTPTPVNSPQLDNVSSVVTSLPFPCLTLVVVVSVMLDDFSRSSWLPCLECRKNRNFLPILDEFSDAFDKDVRGTGLCSDSWEAQRAESGRDTTRNVCARFPSVVILATVKSSAYIITTPHSQLFVTTKVFTRND